MTISRFRWTHTNDSAGLAPQWPSSRCLMSSTVERPAQERVVLAGRSSRPRGSCTRASRRSSAPAPCAVSGPPARCSLVRRRGAAAVLLGRQRRPRAVRRSRFPGRRLDVPRHVSRLLLVLLVPCSTALRRAASLHRAAVPAERGGAVALGAVVERRWPAATFSLSPVPGLERLVLQRAAVREAQRPRLRPVELVDRARCSVASSVRPARPRGRRWRGRPAARAGASVRSVAAATSSTEACCGAVAARR